jgi:hypothetical protein
MSKRERHRAKHKDQAASDGKALEAFVAKIERLSLPPGVTVATNRRLVDESGEQLAEFDIEIQGKIGTTELKWLIECRDRRSSCSAPRSWIEQLIGRRHTYNFGKIVAVSTTPFSRGALLLAKSAGIETRTVTEISPEQIKEWLGLVGVEAVSARFSLTKVIFLPAPGSPAGAAEEIATTLREKKPSDRCIRYQGKGSGMVSSNDIFFRFVSQDPEGVWGGISPDTWHPRRYFFLFSEEREAFFVDTAIGPIRICAVDCDCEVSTKGVRVPFQGHKEYRGSSGELIARASHASHTDVDGFHLHAEAVRVGDSDIIFVETKTTPVDPLSMWGSRPSDWADAISQRPFPNASASKPADTNEPSSRDTAPCAERKSKVAPSEQAAEQEHPVAKG